MKLYIVSDLHFGRGQDDLDARERKEQAAKNIADLVMSEREFVTLALNGDIFHRPDGMAPNPGESFDETAARKQAGPLGEVLRQGKSRALYLPGNCDPWAMGDMDARLKLCALFGSDMEKMNMEFPGFVHKEGSTLLTHGHIFVPPLQMVMKRAMEIDTLAHAQILGKRMEEAAQSSPEFLELMRSLDARGGAHNLTYRFKQLIIDGLFSFPGLRMYKDRLAKAMWKAWDSCYRQALLTGAEQWISRGVDVLAMGHTHKPSVHSQNSEHKEITKEFPAVAGMLLPEHIVNSGSAGADSTSDRAGTFALLCENEEPSILYSYHPDSRFRIRETE